MRKRTTGVRHRKNKRNQSQQNDWLLEACAVEKFETDEFEWIRLQAVYLLDFLTTGIILGNRLIRTRNAV